MNITKELNKLIKNKWGLQTTISRDLGISLSSVTKYLQGDRMPSIKTGVKILRYLQVPKETIKEYIYYTAKKKNYKTVPTLSDSFEIKKTNKPLKPILEFARDIKFDEWKWLGGTSALSAKTNIIVNAENTELEKYCTKYKFNHNFYVGFSIRKSPVKDKIFLTQYFDINNNFTTSALKIIEYDKMQIKFETLDKSRQITMQTKDVELIGYAVEFSASFFDHNAPLT